MMLAPIMILGTRPFENVLKKQVLYWKSTALILSVVWRLILGTSRYFIGFISSRTSYYVENLLTHLFSIQCWRTTLWRRFTFQITEIWLGGRWLRSYFMLECSDSGVMWAPLELRQPLNTDLHCVQITTPTTTTPSGSICKRHTQVRPFLPTV